MKLQEFITQSLIEIAEGIDDANSHFARTSMRAVANPDSMDSTHTSHPTMNYHKVEFDVAVVAQRNSDAQQSAQIEVSSVSESESNAKASVSRLRFTIPMSFPQPSGKSH